MLAVDPEMMFSECKCRKALSYFSIQFNRQTILLDSVIFRTCNYCLFRRGPRDPVDRRRWGRDARWHWHCHPSTDWRGGENHSSRWERLKFTQTTCLIFAFAAGPNSLVRQWNLHGDWIDESNLNRVRYDALFRIGARPFNLLCRVHSFPRWSPLCQRIREEKAPSRIAIPSQSQGTGYGICWFITFTRLL